MDNIAVEIDNILDSADSYRDKSNFKEAISQYEAAIRLAFEHYGPAHPAYSTLLANAAIVYEDQGEYAKAVEILQTAETALAKSYGIISLNNLELNLADTNEQLATISTNIGM